MCMFSLFVSSVADTNIFARGSDGGKQFLVYSMQYQAAADLAMILPLPTPASPPEDAVRFIDLSGYPEFFEDMSRGFFQMTRGLPVAAALGDTSAVLEVHDVGSFEASFVPQLRDFARLDSRFRLPEQVWQQMPQYSDYSFAVFKLKAGAKHIHPMAFEFPRRSPRELFFPTVHVHNGIVEAEAYFDHSLYFQRGRIHVEGAVPSFDPYMDSAGPASKFMDIARTQGIVDAGTIIELKSIYGIEINRDVVIEEEALMPVS